MFIELTYKCILSYFLVCERFVLLASRTSGLDILKILGNIFASAVNISSLIPLGTKNCRFLSSEPPQDDISIIKPFTHLYTNSARLVHHAIDMP
uniref:Putative secreted protein n=1 Tax=Panstrongylus lignarius TaxID=156445 RepID=A0A224XV92_9HEMI